MALQSDVLTAAVLRQLERTGADRLPIDHFLTIALRQLRGILCRHHRGVVGGQVPEERGVRAFEAKLHAMTIQLPHAFHAVGKL